MAASLRTAARLRSALGLAVLAAALLPSPGADGQVAAARSRWWSELDETRLLLDDGRWRKAVRELVRLRQEVLRTSWREPDLGEVLAELAFQAAVAHAELRDDEAALWEWHVALNHERARGALELAGRDLSRYGRAAELLGAQPLRALGEAPPGQQPVTPRPDRDYEPPAAREDFEVEPLVNSAAVQERPGPVILEVLIDSVGRFRHPVLVSSWSHPVTVQWALDNLRRSPPYRPARMEGQPVAVLERVEFHLGDPMRGRSRRDRPRPRGHPRVEARRSAVGG
ncbi:MAG TPA: hypothetical protein VMR44_08100 [Thermoanaerobaculia bacterium]|nr:hypothetical protein [Thermoanaerobaculia bacterium]